MPKVLVTGASGFIGSRIVRHLCEAGHHVKAFVRPTSSLGALRNLPVEVAIGDITVAHTVYRALAGCDRLFHVAAAYRMWDANPAKVLDPAIRGTREVLEAVRRRDGRVRRVVVTSSVAAIGVAREPKLLDENAEWTLDDSEQYVVAKRRAEEIAMEAARELPIIVVNPATVLGPGDAKPTPSGALVVSYLNWKGPPRFPGGPGGFSVVDVDDVARGHLLAMEKGAVGERYILGGDNLTLTQILELLSQITGLRVPGTPPPKWVAMMLGRAMQTWARVTGGEPQLTYRMARDYFDGYFWVTSKKAEEALGYTHRPARKTLARAVRWYLDHGYVDAKTAAAIRFDELPGPDPQPTLPHERDLVFREG